MIHSYYDLTRNEKIKLKKGIIKYELPYPTNFRSKKNRDIINKDFIKICNDIGSCELFETIYKHDILYPRKKLEDENSIV